MDPNQPTNPQPSSPGPSSGPRVLLVEDEDYIRDLYKRQLDASGIATDAAANGQEAFATDYRF
jgi:DNA-binding NtrC family response regulator